MKTTKKRSRKTTAKAVRGATRRRAVAVKAHARKAPQGAARQRKDQVAAQRKHAAHAKSRQRRQQAKRDSR